MMVAQRISLHAIMDNAFEANTNAMADEIARMVRDLNFFSCVDCAHFDFYLHLFICTHTIN